MQVPGGAGWVGGAGGIDVYGQTPHTPASRLDSLEQELCFLVVFRDLSWVQGLFSLQSGGTPPHAADRDNNSIK